MNTQQLLLRGVAEMVATFVFMSVILYVVQGSGFSNVAPLGIALGLAVACMIFSNGANHLNPAVTLMMWVNKSVENDHAVVLVGAQLIGAVAALYVNREMKARM